MANGKRSPTRQKKLEQEWKIFVAELLEEIDDKIVASAALSTITSYVDSLRATAQKTLKDHPDRIRNFIGNDRKIGEIEAAAYLHYLKARDLWGPLLIGMNDWVWATIGPDDVPIFLLRDAGPLYYLSQMGHLDPHMLRRSGRRIWLSRHLLGVEDIWTGQYEGQADIKLVFQYLQQSGISSQRAILVDTGKYGSLIQRLSESPFDWKRQARFLVSGNDHIPGWLNMLDVHPIIRDLVLDSIEIFFAKKYRRVDTLDRSRRHVPEPRKVLTGRVSQAIYEANTIGLHHASRKRPVGHRRPILNCEDAPGFRGIVRLLKEIEHLHTGAHRGQRWTGVLPQPLPLSKDSGEVKKGWPEQLKGVNPSHLLPGGYRANRRTVHSVLD